MYARRVGLIGRLPAELGMLTQLRVLSMGNNQLCGEVSIDVTPLQKDYLGLATILIILLATILIFLQLPESLGSLRSLQRIVLHQNRLTGRVPESLGQLGCIVNLAGNPGLQVQSDTEEERNQ